jgi:anti-sigma factor RsiW
MNCNEARQHFMLYLDSEGDPELHFRMSDHLGMCPDCVEWFAKQQHFEQALNERLADGEATPELWGRVLTRAAINEPVPARRRWLVFGGMLAAAACIVAAVLYQTVGRSHGSELATIAASWHEHWAKGSLKPEFVSKSDEQVETYLKGRVLFRVHCPPRKDVNFAVAGAGVRAAKNQPAAYIVGQVEQAPISIVVLAKESLDAFPRDRAQLAQGGGRHRCREGNYQMVAGITADNVVVVIGTASPATLERVLSAYGSYHEG